MTSRTLDTAEPGFAGEKRGLERRAAEAAKRSNISPRPARVPHCAHFIAGEMSPLALRQWAERQRPDRHPHQPKHVDTERREQTADVAVPPFVEHDLQPTVLPALAQHARPFGGKEFSVRGRALLEPSH